MPCILCAGSSLSNEHVFPQWIRAIIPGEDKIIRHRWISPNDDEATREWSHIELDFKAKDICAKCNNGWMAKLETSVKPYLTSLIQGRGRDLYNEGRAIVSFWLLKTIMMIDLAQEAQHRSIPVEDYAELFKAQTVLTHTYIWLAANSFGEGAFAKTRSLRIKINDMDAIGYGATIGIGHLVAHVIRIPVKDGKILQIGGKLANALVLLWPRGDTVVWPPGVILTHQQAAILGQMIELSPVGIA